MDAEQQFESAQNVFWGEVTERVDDPADSRRIRAVLDVKQVYKGKQRKTFVVTSSRSGVSCGVNLALGHSYLVYGSLGADGTISTSTCSGTHESSIEPIEPGLDSLADLDQTEKNTKRVRAAKRALRVLEKEVRQRANRATPVCEESFSRVYLLRELGITFRIKPSGDYVAVHSAKKTYGRISKSEHRAIDDFIACVIENANSGSNLRSFPGRPIQIALTLSRTARLGWTTNHSIRRSRSSGLSTYFGTFTRVPSRTAESKLKYRIAEVTDLLSSKPAPAYYGDDALDAAESYALLGDCAGAFKTIQSWPEYFAKADEERLQSLEVFCHTKLAQFDRALAVAEKLAADETDPLADDVLRRDVLAYAVERVKSRDGDGASLPLGDASNSFASHWLTNDATGRVRRNLGIEKLFRFISDYGHQESPLFLEALGDLLSRRAGAIPAAHRSAATMAYLRAARSVEDDRVKKQYRQLAGQALQGGEDELDALETYLEKTLEKERVHMRARNAKLEAVYREKLKEFRALRADLAEDGEPKAAKARPAKAQKLRASGGEERGSAFGEETPADESEPFGMLFAAIALGFIALALGVAAFMKDDA